MPHISADRFAARFPNIVLKGNGLPRKEEDRHILLACALIYLEPGRRYTESELNERLRDWSTRFGDAVCLDHVTLRRCLVDDRYLTRDAAGKTYIPVREGSKFTFDQAIWSYDPQELVDNVIREQEERKRLHQQSS